MECQIREEESKLNVLSGWKSSGGAKSSRVKLAVKRGIRIREKLGFSIEGKKCVKGEQKGKGEVLSRPRRTSK